MIWAICINFLKKYSVLQGQILKTSLANENYECGSHCESNENCKWISFNDVVGICQQFETCSEIETQNSEFVSSKLQCFTESGELQKFLYFSMNTSNSDKISRFCSRLTRPSPILTR